MQNENEFQIEDGMLIKYVGKSKHVVIPETVFALADFAFRDCIFVESILFPKTLSSIGNLVLSNCAALEKLDVDPCNKKYYSKNNCIVDRDLNAVVLGCKNSVIPDDNSVTAIEKFAFANCVALEKIVIPQNIKQVRAYAFDGCYNLEEVTLTNNVNYLGTGAFAGCSSLKKIVLPPSVTCISDNVFFDCENLKSFTATDELTFIGISVLENCSPDLVIFTPKDTRAEDYANEYVIKVCLI